MRDHSVQNTCAKPAAVVEFAGTRRLRRRFGGGAVVFLTAVAILETCRAMVGGATLPNGEFTLPSHLAGVDARTVQRADCIDDTIDIINDIINTITGGGPPKP